MVYFVQCNGPKGPVKIGWVRDETRLWKRMAMLSTGNPYPLTVLGTIKEADREQEAALHAKFDPYRLLGEWFTFNDHLKRYIKSHCYGGGTFANSTYRVSKLVG
jgi:hypothetical protein